MLARGVPITELRNRGREIQASLADRPAFLTYGGRPAAVILHYEEYEAREEYISHLEMERDRKLFLEVRSTETEFVPLEEAFVKYERVTGHNLDDYEEQTV